MRLADIQLDPYRKSMSSLFVCPFCDENVPNLSVHHALYCQKLWPNGNPMEQIPVIHLIAESHSGGNHDTLCGEFLHDPKMYRVTPHLTGVTCKKCKRLIENNVRHAKV